MTLYVGLSYGTIILIVSCCPVLSYPIQPNAICKHVVILYDLMQHVMVYSVELHEIIRYARFTVSVFMIYIYIDR